MTCPKCGGTVLWECNTMGTLWWLECNDCDWKGKKAETKRVIK